LGSSSITLENGHIIEALMRSRRVHDPDFSAKRGCVSAPGLVLLLLVMIITGVLVELYRWSHHMVPPLGDREFESRSLQGESVQTRFALVGLQKRPADPARVGEGRGIVRFIRTPEAALSSM
jgi:hypothetical protein